MSYLTNFKILIFNYLSYFYIKVHGLVAAHKKKHI